MKENDKIRDALNELVAREGSVVNACALLKDVARSVINKILKGEYEGISKQKMQLVWDQLKRLNNPWKHAETGNTKMICALLEDAQLHSQCCAIIGQGGIGKTHAFREYTRTRKNVIWLRCETDWTKRYMLQQILRALDDHCHSTSLLELRRRIVNKLKKKALPLLIFDQFNKLSSAVKQMLISLYNDLEEDCGIFISGTSHLQSDILRGVRLDKDGYQEMYSRLGRKFIEIETPEHSDIIAICYANGIEDKNVIKAIWDDCNGDLRRVKRKIHSEQQKIYSKAA